MRLRNNHAVSPPTDVAEALVDSMEESLGILPRKLTRHAERTKIEEKIEAKLSQGTDNVVYLDNSSLEMLAGATETPDFDEDETAQEQIRRLRKLDALMNSLSRADQLILKLMRDGVPDEMIAAAIHVSQETWINRKNLAITRAREIAHGKITIH